MALKPREKILAGVAVLVGIVMGFDQFVTTPKKKELASIQKQVQEYNEQLGTMTVSLSGLNAVKKRVADKKKEKDLSSGKVADDRQLGLLLDQLGKESQKKQLELTHLSINDETMGLSTEKKEGGKPSSFKKVALEVGLLAGYETLGPYLESLQSLPIFLELERIDILRKEDTFPKLQVTIQEGLYLSRKRPNEGPGKTDVRQIQPAS
jgi:hypothetical protein